MIDHNWDVYWETIVNTIQDGIMIIDKDGVIVSVNKAFATMTGFQRQELIGEPCSVLSCDICDAVREEGGKHWCNLFKSGKIPKRKCTFLRKDGIQIHVLKNASILYNNTNQIIGAVESVTDISELIAKDNQIAEFRKELISENSFHGILGISQSMKKVYNLITNSAQSDAPVLILGESGTGKELVSECIHKLGNRKNHSFVKVNCAALTESLLESELFGHVKGAYTGAYKNREGRFELAHKGNLFLDEIGDLPLSTQVKLLRVIEEKVIERVGDNKSVPVDVRIIAATNKKLQEMVKRGDFREDLYFRINVIPIHIPPLRERVEDIPILTEAFFNRLKLKTGKKMIKGIDKEAMKSLMQYDWPGNVRELKAALEFAFVTCDQSMIGPDHFPPHVIVTPSPVSLPTMPKYEKRQPVNNDAVKKQKLIEALEKANGNQSMAAHLLGVSRVTVWNRMKKYNLKIENDIKFL